MRVAFAIWTLGVGVAGAALAEDGPVAPPLPVIECYCTDRTGGRVDLGQTICLIVDGRAYMARCEMSLNVPAWRDTGDDCIGAALSPAGVGLAPGGA